MTTTQASLLKNIGVWTVKTVGASGIEGKTIANEVSHARMDDFFVHYWIYLESVADSFRIRVD